MKPSPIKSSLHTRIRGDIEARIVSALWPPGYRIPPEHELMVQYACSRMTVNKAVAALEAAGLVTRNKRAGTVVAKPPMHAAVLQIPDIRHEVELRGGTYSYQCLLSEVQGNRSTIFIKCLHFEDAVPLAYEERHIFLNSIPEARGVDFTTIPPGTWLIDHVAWTEAENRISAHGADPTTAQALDIAIGAACLVVDRKTWRGSDTITKVKQTFRGDTYDLIARFSPTTS